MNARQFTSRVTAHLRNGWAVSVAGAQVLAARVDAESDRAMFQSVTGDWFTTTNHRAEADKPGKSTKFIR